MKLYCCFWHGYEVFWHQFWNIFHQTLISTTDYWFVKSKIYFSYTPFYDYSMYTFIWFSCSSKWVLLWLDIVKKYKDLCLVGFCFHKIYSGMQSVHPRRFCECLSLQWRHDECGGVSNHRRLDCLLQSFVQAQIKESLRKLRVTGLYERNPPYSPHKGPVTRKMFPFDDAIMSSYILSSHRSLGSNKLGPLECNSLGAFTTKYPGPIEIPQITSMLGTVARQRMPPNR